MPSNMSFVEENDQKRIILDGIIRLVMRE